MTYTIVGLGNPGGEYKETRHNVGRILVTLFAERLGMNDFEYDKKINAQVSMGELDKNKISLILPDTFMNKSGNSLKKSITSAKKAENLIVIHDDLDIPFGKVKLSFGKNSGGHRGVESIMRTIKTKNFIRLRVGISPSTPKGKIKKPKGENKVERMILGKFPPQQMREIKKLSKKVNQILENIIQDGYQKAVSSL